MSIKHFFELQEKVLSYDPKASTDLLKKAYAAAADAHMNRVRASGEPYITHPLAVASILADMKLDEVTISAGMLHDVAADSKYSLHDIEKLFGKEIRAVVSGVTKIFKLRDLSENKARHETLRRGIINITGDLRAIIITLADRLHDIRTLDTLETEKQKRFARETLDIYAPIAHRLGLDDFKTEMEDIAFKYAYPEDYETIKNRVEFNKEIGRQKLAQIKNELIDLMRDFSLEGEVVTRIKSEYAIFRKVERKKIPLDQVYDFLGIRILTDSLKNCYALLGEIYQRWTPIPHRFRDYIVNPKPNGYQAIHTTVITRDGLKVEIQVLTRDMHRVAETGSAAHWKFKEGRPHLENDRHLAWFRNLVETNRKNSNPAEFAKQFKGSMAGNDV